MSLMVIFIYELHNAAVKSRDLHDGSGVSTS
jgi:hypothetical protein